MAKTLIESAVRGSHFKLDPFAVVIVGLDTPDGPEHALYDSRIKLPVDRDMVAGIKVFGVLVAIRVAVLDGTVYVIDGRQRVRSARAAIEELRANGEPCEILVTAIAEKMGDEDRQAQIGAITNEHRFGDSILVRAQKMQTLLDRGTPIQRIAMIFRTTVPTVQASLKIGTLAAPVKRAIESGAISATAAAKLADLPKADQIAALDLAVSESPAKRPSVAKVARIANPDAVRAPSKKALLAALEKLKNAETVDTQSFAEGIRYALGILGDDALPVELREVAKAAE